MGLDAVELEMTDGGVHRIGTDQPAELLEAIRDARGTAGRTRPGGDPAAGGEALCDR